MWQPPRGTTLHMQRPLLNAPKGLTFALLLAYLALACGDSFLHNHPLQDDPEAGRCQLALAVGYVRSAPGPSALERGPAVSHDHDCLACIWAGSIKQPHAPFCCLPSCTQSTPYRLPLQLSYYAFSSHGPCGIRGPPQV